MKKVLNIVLLAFVFVVIAAGAKTASAQSLPFVGGPTSFVAGVYLPTDSSTKHAGGSTQVDLEANYGFPVHVPFTPTRTVISAGAEFGDTGGNHSLIVPITIGEYIGANNRSPFAPQNFYAGLGIGDYIINQSGFSTAGRFGGYGVIGYNLAAGVSIQAKYQVVNYGNGFTVGLGFRF